MDTEEEHVWLGNAISSLPQAPCVKYPSCFSQKQ